MHFWDNVINEYIKDQYTLMQLHPGFLYSDGTPEEKMGGEKYKMKLTVIVRPEHIGRTIESLLRSELNISSRLLKKMRRLNHIYLNGQPHYAVTKVSEGDIIEACPDTAEASKKITPRNLSLEILYQDDCFLVINKRPFMVVHPLCNHIDDTVANGVAYLLMKEGHKAAIHPVNRLDRDTSGIVLFAKNAYVQEELTRQMHVGTFVKEYIAFVSGCPNPEKGLIDAPIARTRNSIMLREVAADGAKAITHYETLKSDNKITLLKLRLETGRTHQIRVHLCHIGHTIIGDTLYGDTFGEQIGITRQMLHSWHTSFVHPVSKKQVSFTAPLPADMQYIFK